MSNQLTYQLFALIKSLSKSEKRHFKLYANRNFGQKEMKFVKLFDVLDKLPEYDEKKVRQKIDVEGNLLSNLKAHLYDQILVSLRLLDHKDEKNKIRETISFAHLLYKRGLYHQSLGLLGKAKIKAKEQQSHLLFLEVLELEKEIEARHITRAYKTRAEEIIEGGTDIRKFVVLEGKWSDVALELYDFYLKTGHIKNKTEYKTVYSRYIAILQAETKELPFFANIYRFQAHVWFYYILQDFSKCFRYSVAWIAAFDAQPQFIKLEPDLYMRGLHNCLSALFYCNDRKRFQKYYFKLVNFIEDHQENFSENSKIHAFLYEETAQINYHFLQGQFRAAIPEIEAFEERLIPFETRIDEHRILIFWYKIACIYFGSDRHRETIKYLNKIINNKSSQLREDVQCFARILSLITHYEMGNDEVIDYQIKSTYRFLLKMQDLQKVQRAILVFLKRSVFMDRKDLRVNFIWLRDELDIILEDPYERRPLLYLDLISWLECKIDGRKVEDVILEKQSPKK